MLGIGVRFDPLFMEFACILKMLLHSGFEVLLGAAYVYLIRVVARDFVYCNRLTAAVVVSTVIGSPVVGVTVAISSHEVQRLYVSRKFGRQISIEDFPEIGESVVRHFGP